MKKKIIKTLTIALLGSMMVSQFPNILAYNDTEKDTNIVTTGNNGIETISKGLINPKVKEMPFQNVLMQNYFKNDYNYNSSHFDSKKIDLNISIPEDIKEKFKKYEIVIINGHQKYYIQSTLDKDILFGKEDLDKKVIKDSDAKVIFDITDTEIPKSLIIKREEVKKLFTEGEKSAFEYLNITFYGEDFDGKKVQLSKTGYFSFEKDNEIGKRAFYKQFIRNKLRFGTNNIAYKFKEILAKKRKEMTIENYMNLLDKIQGKLNTLIEKNKLKEKEILSKTKTEEDFTKYINEYNLFNIKSTLYNSIGYTLAKEKNEMIENNILDQLF